MEKAIMFSNNHTNALLPWLSCIMKIVHEIEGNLMEKGLKSELDA